MKERCIRVRWLAILACVALPGAGFSAVMPSRQALVYDRADLTFASAVFFKPAESGGTNLSFALAPLLIQEISQAVPGAAGKIRSFGSLVVTNQVLELDRDTPTIYFDTDAVDLRGKTYARFTYAWCYSLLKRYRKEKGLPLQGVRITLDSAGRPVIWEMLADDSGLEVIFVASSLEELARTQFGPPLPGRRYAIERSLREARNVVVARVIDDGPVPMGPIVYLRERTHSTGTVICRCMPAQAKALAETQLYKLVPLPMASPDCVLTQARLATGLRTAFWPGARSREPRLEKGLRLPDGF